MPTGNVSIRLSVQDAETVRAALEKLGKDGESALKKIEAAGTKPGAGLSAVDKTVADLKGRMEGTAGSIGLLGTFLTNLGPVGLVAAAGIAGVIAVLYEASKAANELGDRAQQLRTFAEAAGLTTDEVQALTAQGADLSLSAENIGTALQRLTANLGAAHSGTGALYTALHQLSPELAHQVAGAKDVATAYDLIGRAIANAKSKAEAASIAQAAFGRGGVIEGELAARVYQSGGLAAIGSGAQQAGTALDSGLLQRLATLRSQIKEIEQENADLRASWFAETVLGNTLSLDRAMQQGLLHMQEMQKIAKDESWGEWLKNVFLAFGAGAEGGAPVDLGAQLDEQRRRQWIQEHGYAAGLGQLKQAMGGGGVKAGSISDYVNSEFGALATPKPGSIGGFKGADNEELKEIEKYVKSLGGAATAQDKYVVSLAKLRTEFKDGGGAALDMGAKEKQLEAQLSKLAQTSPVVARAFRQLKDAEMVAIEGARQRIGIASQEEILAAKMVQVKKDEADGYIKTEAEKRVAIAATQKAAEEAYKAEQVRASRTPGLTQMGQFQFDDKAADQLATRDLDQLDTTLVKVIDNTNKAKSAWRDFGLSATEALQQTLLKALLLAPIARGLSGMFGGAGAGGGSDPSAGAGGGGFLSLFGLATGGIMSSHGPLSLMRYASGGIATGPQLALFGEGRQNEAFVPLPDGRAIPVRLAGGAGGGRVMQVSNEYHVHIDGARGSKEIEDAVNAGVARANGHAAALVRSYDKALPSRIADANMRHG
jgi:hypothetical protein